MQINTPLGRIYWLRKPCAGQSTRGRRQAPDELMGARRYLTTQILDIVYGSRIRCDYAHSFCAIEYETRLGGKDKLRVEAANATKPIGV